MDPQNAERAKQILRDITNPTEALLNLLYLIRDDANNVKQVLRYVAIAETQANCLVEVIRRGPEF